MRLIDADVLMAHIDEIYKGYMTDECGCVPYDFEKIVDEQTTAYDIDKVVEELKEYKRIAFINGIMGIDVANKMIEIVKAGGKE